MKGLSFNNVLYKHKLRWHGDNVLVDSDGSLTGKAGDVVLFDDAHYNSDSRCRKSSEFLNGLVCSGIETQIRYSFNNYQPSAAVLMNITNQESKTVQMVFSKKRLTHPFGKFEFIDNVSFFLFLR